MADSTVAAFDLGRSPEADPGTLGEPVDFDVRGLGRRLPRTEAPEGWIKKIERRREGKVWIGFFHLWTTDANGRRVRQKKEKTLGPRVVKESSESGVELEQAAESVATANGPALRRYVWRREEEKVALTLVVPFRMMMIDVLDQRAA